MLGVQFEAEQFGLAGVLRLGRRGHFIERRVAGKLCVGGGADNVLVDDIVADVFVEDARGQH